MDPDQLFCVQTTAASNQAASTLARHLVERRLAACVQVQGPIASTYWWQGAVEHSEEWLCVAKTTGACLEPLKQAILELHTYEVPEIIATRIEDGSPEYLEWIRGELKRR